MPQTSTKVFITPSHSPPDESGQIEAAVRSLADELRTFFGTDFSIFDASQRQVLHCGFDGPRELPATSSYGTSTA